MTPEERAIALLYDGYIAEAQPIVNDEVLTGIERIGNYTDHLLKRTRLTSRQRQDVTQLSKVVKRLHQVWLRKPPLTYMTDMRKTQLRQFMCPQVTKVVSISTIVLIDGDEPLTSIQEMYLQTINETGDELLDQIEALL